MIPYEPEPKEIHITSRRVAIPFLHEEGGFGQVVVTLEPGARETVTINGRQIIVIRDYTH